MKAVRRWWKEQQDVSGLCGLLRRIEYSHLWISSRPGEWRVEGRRNDLPRKVACASWRRGMRICCPFWRSEVAGYYSCVGLGKRGEYCVSSVGSNCGGGRFPDAGRRSESVVSWRAVVKQSVGTS